MFESVELDNHLKRSDTIKINSRVFAEWNMNDPENIRRLGNYRYRPSYPQSPYYLLPSTYIDNEIGPVFYYTGATDSDTIIESGLNDQDEPTLFLSPQQKMKMLFSLEDCVKPFRPRSGINKLLYLGSIGAAAGKNQFIDDGRSDSARRPRYYMASKDDQFKYWTSFRKELGTPTPPPGGVVAQVVTEVIRGVSFFDSVSGRNYIEDASPFVVYNEKIPTNKIVVKMQTNVGEIGIGQLRYNDETDVLDPLFGDENKTTPVRWKIEGLKENSWETLISFDENSLQEDGSPLIGADGYLEISYGLKIPEQYSQIFIFAEEINSTTILPDVAPEGYAYLVKENNEDIGIFYIYVEGQWKTFAPDYGWELSSQELSRNSHNVKKITNPYYFVRNNKKIYREFDFIGGLRVVVQTMNKSNCTFDLIELSPRIFADITDSVNSYSIVKVLSGLDQSSAPVGGLFASTGSLEIFDTDFSFNENNLFNDSLASGSIISKYLNKMVKFVFYESVLEIDEFDYYIPIKTMYSYGIPQIQSPTSTIQIELRDFFFFLESSPAPQLLLTDISLSYAIMILLDYIGFDNYVFKRIENTPEIIIPYFFVDQGQNVAEVLQKLAIASQSAMFFDEYNNFVVMSKEYLLPSDEVERPTDSYLLGQQTIYDKNDNSYSLIDFVYDESELPEEEQSGCFVNINNSQIYIWQNNQWQSVGVANKNIKPNISSFSSQQKRVYNAGQINYTSRYLQRSIGSTTAALKIDEYKNYIYKPVLLWEAQGNQNRQTVNELGGQMGGYVLGAVPLNTNLSADPPYALNNRLYNNIIDVGENVYWMTNYNGYFYSSGEIIKYDAIEYIVSGQVSPVWIINNQQYQDYFGRLPFNGKMYPTGRVRIYTDPELEGVNGEIRLKDANPIAIHGRAQFGTKLVNHSAGIDDFWINNDNVYGCVQEASKYLFTTKRNIDYPQQSSTNTAGKTVFADSTSKQSFRTGIIKNFLTDKNFTESDLNYKKTTEPGTVQSSAFCFTGPATSSPSDFVSYVYKDFLNSDGSSIPYKHYGTRMRIIGNIELGTNKSQTPLGNFPIFTGSPETQSPPTTTTTTNQEEVLRGGSGGIGINVDKTKNTGYFFEIMALTASNISLYNNGNNSNIANYNILSAPPATMSVTGVVTVNLDVECNLVVGDRIIVNGLSINQMNGEFSITEISSDKKQIKYQSELPPDAPSNEVDFNSFPRIGGAFDYGQIFASRRNSVTSNTGGILSAYSSEDTSIANVFFYKVYADNEGRAIPQKLWSGLVQINVDGGEFYGQGRLMGEENSTVYDLAAEYINVGSSRRFYLYLNNKQVAVVDDRSPLPEKNSLALFVRGESKCMFENVYALKNNYSQNTTFPTINGVAKIFGDEEIDATESLRKYALSGIVQKTYLSGISGLEDPKYDIYYEEFGSIFREAAYFNVLYDRAYPALYAKLMKTTNNLKGYTTSGFYAWSYGAEFLIFNNTDFAITLDDTSGNYLRILGVSFTQNTSYTLTVDDLYKKKSNLLDVQLGNNSSLIYNALTVEKEYNAIQNSRRQYGKNEITIESPYIQSSDAAENILSWIIQKTFRDKKIIVASTFATQNLQLGDIVSINYKNNDGIDVLSSENTRFTIYQIEHKRQASDIEMILYLAEI